jgi:hypothetical protein
MEFEDFPPFKALGLPIGLYGPAPKMPSSCTCGRFIVEDFCMCATSCMSMPKWTWAKENPEAYAAEQAGEARWLRVWRAWSEQKRAFDLWWYTETKVVRRQFNLLRDAQSAIGCHECETRSHDYCVCECRDCGDKYCDGSCAYEDDGDDY